MNIKMYGAAGQRHFAVPEVGGTAAVKGSGGRFEFGQELRNS